MIINHEGDNLDEYDQVQTDGGNLYTSAAAALHGNYGLTVVIDDANGVWGRKDLTITGSHMRTQYRIDPNTLSMSAADAFYHLYFHSTNGTIDPFLRYYLNFDGTNYEIQVFLTDDTGASHNTLAIDISDAPTCVETYVYAHGANGFLQLWIDDVLEDTIAGLNNDTGVATIDYLLFGAVGGVDVGTTGVFYLDDLTVSETSEQIGCGAPPYVPGTPSVTGPLAWSSVTIPSYQSG
ncbi:MAG: hypothetical protein PVJ86_09160 [Phycisphaerales bacterium]|jgi:hypothetical protein